uniref:PiggyBac transposable element-derived protein domain-containing protein n=1 Tax=Erpetoichthys calabaricus TaxID=27687 RepID=A0A8C4X3H4_ERPCA
VPFLEHQAKPLPVGLIIYFSLYETDDTIEASTIVKQPPENATSPVSDEDPGDEEGGTINNLPGSLLRTPVYLIQDDNYPDDEVPSTSTAQTDVRNVLVSAAMRRDCFETIFSNLHVADNANLVPMDKFSKLRPLINKLNDRCMKFVPNETYFSFDESMVPYFGRHGCKQFIRGKPIRFGFKFWCGATRLGYICWFQPYQGKNPDNKHGVSASLVLQFSEALVQAHPGQYHFVFDNFFTSITLLDKLSSMGHQATGTVRKDRIDKAPLESDVVLKKKEKEANGSSGVSPTYRMPLFGDPRSSCRTGRPSQKRNIDSCYDGLNHVIVKQGKQTRCAQCHKNTTF